MPGLRKLCWKMSTFSCDIQRPFCKISLFPLLKLLCSARMKAAQSSPHSPWPSTTPLQFISSRLHLQTDGMQCSMPQNQNTSEHGSIQGHPVNTSQTDTKGDTHVFHHEVGVLHFVSPATINCHLCSQALFPRVKVQHVQYSHVFLHQNFLSL